MITIADLQAIPELSDLETKDLEWLREHCSEQIMEPGDAFWQEGEPIEDMFIVFSGAVQFHIRQAGQLRLFDTWRKGRILGVLPYSRMTHVTGKFDVIEPTRVGLVHKSHFREMLYQIPQLGQRLIGLMSDRVRSAARTDQEREKMLALGKLSAGLTHELNNPAAAVKRSAEALQERLDQIPQLVDNLNRHGVTPGKLVVSSSDDSSTASLSTVRQAEQEDAVIEWLEERGIEKSLEMGPALVEAGMGPADLDILTMDMQDTAIPDALFWVTNHIAAQQLVEEIQTSAERISGLIASVKSYSHMDKSTERQATDVVKGLESTLTMLGHKIKQKNLSVERRFAPDLLAISAYTGELNQVWTNVLDNAIDAAPEGGQLEVAVNVEGKSLVIRIIDDGSGISDDVLPRIFEPFFTTKDVGEGTGVGLEIVHRIVTQQHSGKIEVKSEPGRTEFIIGLPF